MIIGLTGRNGAGKGEVAKFLQQIGFEYHSLSDIIRETIQKKGQEVTRERLIEAGTKLREKDGLGALAERTLKKLGVDKNYAIDSIRSPHEVIAFKKHRPDFRLINVTAPVEVRFARIKKRAREKDSTTLASFKEMEQREFRNSNPAGQQLLETEKLADIIVSNASSVEDLQERVRKALITWVKSQKRPPWDVYFMEIARAIAARSNCVKRRVAAMIVKDRRIISTGYNGTPRGVTNCNEGGCPRCNSFGKSGQSLDECFCSHAEENAITQAAYHGVSIQGTTLYTTFSPCLMCTKMIINSGIQEVIFDAHYPLMDIASRLLKQAGVKLRKISND